MTAYKHAAVGAIAGICIATLVGLQAFGRALTRALAGDDDT